jgi:CxxC motif-containing protein
MNREMTCIACPIGCQMTISVADQSEAVSVSGNRCARGEIYGREEVLAPKRVVTATVPLLRGDLPRLSVRTDQALQKELIPGLLSQLYATAVEAPVHSGDIILADYRSTGVSVVATRTCRMGGGS